MGMSFADRVLLIFLWVETFASAYRPSDGHGADDGTISPTLEAAEHSLTPEEGFRALGVLNSGQLLQTSRRHKEWLFTEGSPSLNGGQLVPNRTNPSSDDRQRLATSQIGVSLLQTSDPSLALGKTASNVSEASEELDAVTDSNETAESNTGEATNGDNDLASSQGDSGKKGNPAPEAKENADAKGADQRGASNTADASSRQQEQTDESHQNDVASTDEEKRKEKDAPNGVANEEHNKKKDVSNDEHANVDDSHRTDSANSDKKKKQTKEEREKNERAVATLTLTESLKHGKADKFRHDLDSVSVLLRDDPKFFDINLPPSSSLKLLKQTEHDTTHDGLTFLGRAAKSAWLEGVQALVEWDEGRTDSGPRLNINAGGKTQDAEGHEFDTSPLTLAAESKEKTQASVVKYLLQRRASVMVPNQDHLTPLEIAAGSDQAGDVVEALLTDGSPLAFGMAQLRMELAKDAEKLPKLLKRWPFGNEENDPMAGMKQKVTSFPILISPEEQSEIGDRPSDWVLMYKNRVMRALAKNPNRGNRASSKPDAAESTENAEAARLLLVAHGYDTFAHDFSFSIVVCAVFFGIVGLFVYVIFRIKLYGGPDAPLSLAHMVPGAFDPARLADPDFDPSKQTTTHLPYKESSSQIVLVEAPPSLKAASVAFIKALFGVFSSWTFLAVRIPPVKEPFDEDFLSDDDETSRTKVCEQTAERARLAHKFEVFCRTVTFGFIVWWLAWKAQRWGEASIVFFMYLQFCLVAASAAAGTVPVPAPQQRRNAFEPASSLPPLVDSARLTYALFGVQQGPRWARAVPTTRSTAAPSKNRLARRRNHRKPPKTRDNDKGTVSDGTEGLSDGTEDPLPGKKIQMEGVFPLKVDAQTSFTECWERSFIQAGLLHIRHGAFLELSISCIVVISSTILWLTHLRALALGSFHRLYARHSPSALFSVYGAPGSGDRGVTLLLEIGLLFFTAERLVGIIDILVTAALTLQQRYRALVFAGDHPPPPIPESSGHEAGAVVKEAIRRIDEGVHCTEFACELSALRWSVLRTPVLLIFTIDLMLLTLAMTTLVLTYVESTSSFMSDLLHHWSIDAVVPLGVALCLTWPLILVLVAGSMANAKVFEQRMRLRRDVSPALTALGDQADDVQYVQLRLKLDEALQNSMICWPGGKELGMFEPCTLLGLATIACGFAMASGIAAAGTSVSPKPSLL